MGFTPPRRQLRGLSVDVAELYGKPHLGACYRGTGANAKAYRVLDGARCAICRWPATNAHHVPPLSKGRGFLLSTPRGEWLLRPSLFALCGSGTTGCHDGFHGGARFFPRWVWRDDRCARAWWGGDILSELAPHDPGIFAYGHWLVEDRLTGREYRFIR